MQNATSMQSLLLYMFIHTAACFFVKCLEIYVTAKNPRYLQYFFHLPQPFHVLVPTTNPSNNAFISSACYGTDPDCVRYDIVCPNNFVIRLKDLYAGYKQDSVILRNGSLRKDWSDAYLLSCPQ